MKTARLVALVAATAVSGLVGCGPSTPPAEEPPPPPPPASAPVAVTPPPPEPVKPVEPPPPTPEEKKKAEDAKQLADDRAAMEVDTKAENERWTPELHAAAKALASAKYPNMKAALAAILASKHRKPGAAERDKYRHPKETLEAWGITPSSTVLEIGPGEGWFTEILAPALATRGKLMVTTGDPAGPADQRSTFYAERLKRFLDRSPELYGKVDRVLFDAKAPKLGLDGKVDVVLLSRALHGLHRDKLMTGVLAEVHKALKPGGILAIEQHRAKADANPDDAAKKGYLPEAWLIQQIEAAGFKLASKSEVNANPKDTKDYEDGVWALPPTLRQKDKDRAKYVEIGESDRMTLKFTRVEAPGEKPAPKPAKKKLGRVGRAGVFPITPACGSIPLAWSTRRGARRA